MAAAACLIMWLAASIMFAQLPSKNGSPASQITKNWWTRSYPWLSKEMPPQSLVTNSTTASKKCRKFATKKWTTTPRLYISSVVVLWPGSQVTNLSHTTTWLAHPARRKLPKIWMVTDVRTAISLSQRLIRHSTSLLSSVTILAMSFLAVLGRPEIKSWACLLPNFLRFLTQTKGKSKTSPSPACSPHLRS